MRILIVKLSAFGDIIHTLPAVDDLLRRTDVGQVHWLLDTRYAFVSEMLPTAVHVHRLPLKELRRWRRTWRGLRLLRGLDFDAVLDMQGLIKSGLLARAIGGRTFGVDSRHVREKPNGLLVHPVRFHPGERHVVQQYRRIAAAPFSTQPHEVPAQPLPYKPPHVACTPMMRKAGAQVLAHWRLESRPFVWLHMGGGWATKQLPLKTWIEVAEGLAAAEITPVAGWGNAREQIEARRLKQSVPGALVPARRLGAPALCGVLARARTVVAPDTGVLHLGAALGTPTVSFWGPSASWRSAPWGKKHRHVESNPDCGPCFQRNCDHFICMDRIRADAILAAIHAAPST